MGDPLPPGGGPAPNPGPAPELPRGPIDMAGAARRAAAARRGPGADANANKLVVGRDISLNGGIAHCDTLIVEGRVEATLEDSRLLEVAESGAFRGSIVIDEAVIAGVFEGELVAREKLVVRPTGRVRGAVRSRRIEVELGGEIEGQVGILRDDAGPEPDAAP